MNDQPKTRKTLSASERAVRTILAMPLGDLTKFAGTLIEADIATAKFLADKINENVEEVDA